MTPAAMHPNDAVALSVRNHRPNRLVRPLVLVGLGCFWAGLLSLYVTGVLDRLPFPSEVLIIGFGIVTCGVLAVAITYMTIQHWKLGETFVVWPGREYQPGDIREIVFAPDPAEDYDDSATPARRCEVRARLRGRGELRLIASVVDGRRVRDWAARRGIAVAETGQVLSGPGSGP
jgi:hypothetical protein